MKTFPLLIFQLWPQYESFCAELRHFGVCMGNKSIASVDIKQTIFWIFSSIDIISIYHNTVSYQVPRVLQVPIYYLNINICKWVHQTYWYVKYVHRYWHIAPSVNKHYSFLFTHMCVLIKQTSNKVHIFWEGHKILQNLHLRFDRMKYSQI